MILSDYARQPWPIRVYRWLRYRPIWAARSVYWLAVWLLRGAPVPLPEVFNGRRDYARHLWLMGRSMAHCSMRDTLPLRDFIANLK